MTDLPISMMFETPLIEAELHGADAMNAALMSGIRTRRNGSELAVATPWIDGADLLTWAADAASLAEQVVALAARCSVDVGAPDAPRFAWRCSLTALALPSGAALPLTDRPGVTWTVYYCIDAGPAGHASGGRLQLYDPRMPTLHMVAPDVRFRVAGGAPAGDPLVFFEPAAGRMMMVPGWLRTGISRYEAPGEQLWVIADVFAQGRFI